MKLYKFLQPLSRVVKDTAGYTAMTKPGALQPAHLLPPFSADLVLLTLPNGVGEGGGRHHHFLTDFISFITCFTFGHEQTEKGVPECVSEGCSSSI